MNKTKIFSRAVKMSLPKEWIIIQFSKGYDFDITSREVLLTRRQMIGQIKKLEVASPNGVFKGKNLHTFEIYNPLVHSDKKDWTVQKYNKELCLWENMASSEHRLTWNQMKKQLKELEKQYQDDEFRGHNWVGCIEHSCDQYL